jgi:hypothetical protein
MKLSYFLDGNTVGPSAMMHKSEVKVKVGLIELIILSKTRDGLQEWLDVYPLADKKESVERHIAEIDNYLQSQIKR